MDSMDSRRLDWPLGDRGGRADGGRADGGRADGGRAGELTQDGVAGAPRKPAELLDQLRQRLGRLADNHPSSAREPERAKGGRLDPRAEGDRRASAGDSLAARDDSGNQAELESGNESSEL